MDNVRVPGVQYDITARWEQGIPHHPESVKLYKRLEKIDWAFAGDYFCWKHGGDGDNGETLMYELDILFEEREKETGMELQGHHSKERDDLYGEGKGEPMKPHTPMYRNPFPAVDVIITVGSDFANRKIVLVRRKNPPHGWALPGGFVEYGEALFTAAVREAKEETGLDVTLSTLLHVYSRPDRDPRQHVVSTVFIGFAEGTPVGADDAAEARLFSLDELPPLVFDHAKILADYVQYLKTGARPNADR